MVLTVDRVVLEKLATRNFRFGFMAALLGSGLILQGCASAPTGSVEAGSQSNWPVLYEPGYQEQHASKTALGNPSSETNKVAYNASETVIGTISFGSGVVSIGKDAESQAKVRALASQIGRVAPSESVVVRGYAVNDKGVARAQQTAHWRAESLYYGLSRAGVPRASMLIETRVVSSNSGSSGRQAVVVKQR